MTILSKNPNTGWYTELGSGYALANTHDPKQCSGRGCAIHDHPSFHPLRDAPLNWRTDAGKLERICTHGIGHDDRDAVEYLRATHPNLRYIGVHGCDGCCSGTAWD